MWSTGKESSTSFMLCWGIWGRIFCFLTRDTLGVLDPLGKNLLNPHYGLFKYAWVHRGRIFCVLRRDDVLNMLDPLGKNLLFPYWDSVLEFMWSVGNSFRMYMFQRGKSLLLPLLLTRGSLVTLFLIGAILRCFSFWIFLFYFILYYFIIIFLLFTTKLHVV